MANDLDKHGHKIQYLLIYGLFIHYKKVSLHWTLALQVTGASWVGAWSGAARCLDHGRGLAMGQWMGDFMLEAVLEIVVEFNG